MSKSSDENIKKVFVAASVPKITLTEITLPSELSKDEKSVTEAV